MYSPISRSSAILGVFTLVALAGLTIPLSLRGVAEEDAKREKESAEAGKLVAGPFVHVALYTFKADAPAGTAAEFTTEAEQCFRQIKAVRTFRIGKPATKATPKAFMVDPRNNYDLGVILTFDNFDGMAQYGNHDRHNVLKKKYGKHFEKIVAYDFE